MNEPRVLQEINKIDLEMASLDIAERCRNKRRLSGFVKSSDTKETSFDESDISDNEAISDQMEEESDSKLRRSTRKRFRPTYFNAETSTSRMTSQGNTFDVESYYLTKKVKRLAPTLETIFEEPKEEHNTQVFMSSRKFKRYLCFDDLNRLPNRMKVKKRQMKAKRLNSGKRQQKKVKVSLELLKQKLENIENEPNSDTEVMRTIV